MFVMSFWRTRALPVGITVGTVLFSTASCVSASSNNPCPLFDSKLLSRLRSKVYLEGSHLPSQINILTVRLPHPLIEGSVTEFRNYRGNPFELAKSMFLCESVAIVDLEDPCNNNSNLDAVALAEYKTRGEEEFYIRLNGLCPFGAEMRPSGWFSGSILRRYYGRDDESDGAKPHCVIIFAYHESETNNNSRQWFTVTWILAQCRSVGIPAYVVYTEDSQKIVLDAVNRDVKKAIIRHALQEREDTAFAKGMKQGGAEQFIKGYQKGLHDGEKKAKENLGNIYAYGSDIDVLARNLVKVATGADADSDSSTVSLLQQVYDKLSSRRLLSSEIPDGAQCPITLAPMQDPVVTPYGHSYEKASILRHLQVNGNVDPMTRQSLRADQLTPNRSLKSVVDWLRGRGLI